MIAQMHCLAEFQEDDELEFTLPAKGMLFANQIEVNGKYITPKAVEWDQTARKWNVYSDGSYFDTVEGIDSIKLADTIIEERKKIIEEYQKRKAEEMAEQGPTPPEENEEDDDLF